VELTRTVPSVPDNVEQPGQESGPQTAPAHALTPDQLRRLLQVHLNLDADLPERHPAAQFAQRIAAIVGLKVAIAVRQEGTWSVVTESSADPMLAMTGAGPVFDRASAAPHTVRAEHWPGGARAWTMVACATLPAAVLAIEGDWSRSAPAFSLLARNLSVAWQAHVAGLRAHRRLSGHQLARSLVRVRGSHAVWNAVVRKMAQSVDARIAALAVPDATDRHLQIVATHGYPLELVEHLRIEPGAGVLGGVFQSGRALHASGGDALPVGRRRRPRYRTDSFIAMPIGPAREPLGVICVTDRRDGRPFTRDDVAALRALVAPAALALGRERALVQAESYAHAAAIDPLSGAFNRRYFHARLDEELQRARRHRLSLTLLMIDIDDFKSINDSFGHLAGDTVIRDIAEILRRSVRIFDVCARFGGEEFAIIMPGSVSESAAKVAGRIRERVEAYRPFDRALEALRVTASVGLAESSIGMTGHELIERADHALYRAKRDGKNRVRMLMPGEPMQRMPLPGANAS
jgi:diguanylate cyclase (GGDEF)-like protein